MGCSKKKKQLNTVSLKIRMDCEGCAHKMKNVLCRLKGRSEISGRGLETAEGNSVRICGCKEGGKGSSAQSTGKKVEPWPYVPYELMAHPYATGVYDKKAPSNFVRSTNEPGVATFNPVEEKYSLMFSDDNPHACSIM
ncbi:hypothetical protein CASFOL_017200 [Castilleja foliolosa]|uniref:Uncharacterized protein n=1 Tax=Castilleja foliolosa TaxID=1961234 RepID=A0ABD3DAV0_9LAMI